MFPFLLSLLSSIGSGIGSAGSAIGSGIGTAASSIGSGIGGLLTKGGAASQGPASVGMTGGMSDLPAMSGTTGLGTLANSVVPGSSSLLTKGNFMGNFNEMLKDPRFLNYLMRQKVLPEQQEERKKYS